jgi:hypothetical protein
MKSRIEHKSGCYRICRTCRLEWNVSGKYKKIRQYVCPKCEYKERKNKQ